MYQSELNAVQSGINQSINQSVGQGFLPDAGDSGLVALEAAVQAGAHGGWTGGASGEIDHRRVVLHVAALLATAR